MLAVALAVHAGLSEHILPGLRGAAGVAAAALGLLAAWALLSGTWSDAPARAVIESDRVVVYLLAVAALAAPALSANGLRLAVAGVASAIVVVCGIGLVTRVAPDVWSIADGVGKGRLSYPLTYWNSFGLLAVVGGLLCLHLTSDERVPRLGRVAAAAAVPGLVAALVLSYSRGAVAAGVVGLVAYLVLGRPRLGLPGLLATVPATALAAISAYGAERLATNAYDAPAGIEQGHDVALVVGVATLGAALLRALLLWLDARLVDRPQLGRTPRLVLAGLGVAVVLAAGGGAVAAGVPGEVSDAYDEFVEGRPLQSSNTDVRSRITDPSNNGRIEYWEISLDTFAEDRLKGSGAGTFQHIWARERAIPVTVIDAHTLYGEILAELGAVGMALLAVALIALLVGIGLRMRGAGRALHACVGAVLLAWMLAAAVDWHWELPAVTLPVLALAAAAAGGRRVRAEAAAEAAREAGERPGAVRAPRGSAPPGTRRTALPARLAAAVGALLLAATPAAAALSQSRLNDAVDAFRAGDCTEAVDSAAASLDVMDFRPEPLEVIGFCRSRQDRHDEAQRALERAVDRDPESWELHYGLAIVRAAAGVDPRPQTARALQLNPREVLVERAIERLGTDDDPRHWRRVAPTLELPIS